MAYAHYIRQTMPNASFIGFTGTPIEAADVNTPAIFGEYIDVYDINRAVEDGATVRFRSAIEWGPASRPCGGCGEVW